MSDLSAYLIAKRRDSRQIVRPYKLVYLGSGHHLESRKHNSTVDTAP